VDTPLYSTTGRYFVSLLKGDLAPITGKLTSVGDFRSLGVPRIAFASIGHFNAPGEAP
jgi:hypothetical protein